MPLILIICIESSGNSKESVTIMEERDKKKREEKLRKCYWKTIEKRPER